MTKDPVCGMELDEQQAVASLNYQGQQFYFCSTSCQHLFEQNPQHYIKEQDTDQQAARAKA